MEKNKILNKIKEKIFAIYPTAKIILYGSRARGDYKKISDWDLLILLNETVNFKQKIEINDNLFDVELEVDEIICPIIHNVSEWENLKITPFYQNVQREGIQI